MLSNVIKWKLRLIGEGGEINNRYEAVPFYTSLKMQMKKINDINRTISIKYIHFSIIYLILDSLLIQ